jgi:hypothetical protein
MPKSAMAGKVLKGLLVGGGVLAGAKALSKGKDSAKKTVKKGESRRQRIMAEAGKYGHGKGY